MEPLKRPILISDYDDLARDLLGIFEEEALYNLNDEDLNEDLEDFDDYEVALDNLDVEDEEESDEEVDEIALYEGRSLRAEPKPS